MVRRLEARLGARRSTVSLRRDAVSLVVRAALRKRPASVYPPVEWTSQGSFGGTANTDSRSGSDTSASYSFLLDPITPP